MSKKRRETSIFLRMFFHTSLLMYYQLEWLVLKILSLIFRYMGSGTIALISILILFVLMFLKMPISFAMFLVGFVGIYFLLPSGAAFNLLSANIWTEFSSYSLSVIPFYVLMGEIVFRSGISKNIFEAAYRWIGHFRGGMAITTILASAGFASICGSNSATAATMGTIALPELKKYKYDEALSTGTVATGGTLGIIIPPSTVLILLALLTQQSIGALFVASVIPAILLVSLMVGVIIFLCWRNPALGPPAEKSTWAERFKATIGVAPIFTLFAFVICGLYIGLFTPTESGAYGAFGAIVITLLMRKLTFSAFKQAITSTLKTSAMIMMLVVGAVLFGRFLTAARLPFIVADFINSLAVPAIVILLIILLIYVIGGALMDSLGFLMVSIPVFFPIILQIGYDPVWFCVLVCIITSMGAITPPIGLNVFVVQGLDPNYSVVLIFKGAAYYLVAYAIFIAVYILLPGMALVLLS